MIVNNASISPGEEELLAGLLKVHSGQKTCDRLAPDLQHKFLDICRSLSL